MRSESVSEGPIHPPTQDDNTLTIQKIIVVIMSKTVMALKIVAAESGFF